MTRALISLGSNLGPATEHFGMAIAGLAREPGHRLIACSATRASAALGPVQGAFVNQVVCLETRLPPFTLLALLQALERAAGRRPHRRRWGARILDLDLLRYGALTLQTHALTLPHPGLARAYLQPLIAELEQKAQGPGEG